MSWMIVIGFLLAIALSCVLIYAVYSGACRRVIVSTDRDVIREMTIAYKFYTGSYKKCGAAFMAASRLAPNKTVVGIYYDDPRETPADKQRYAVGCVVGDGDDALDEKAWRSLNEGGYTLKKLPAPSVCVHATFPYRTYLSVTVAALRVYPRLDSYIKERSLSWGPTLEIYEDGTIKFVVPQDTRDGLYVSEALANGTPCAK